MIVIVFLSIKTYDGMPALLSEGMSISSIQRRLFVFGRYMSEFLMHPTAIVIAFFSTIAFLIVRLIRTRPQAVEGYSQKKKRKRRERR